MNPEIAFPYTRLENIKFKLELYGQNPITKILRISFVQHVATFLATTGLAVPVDKGEELTTGAHALTRAGEILGSAGSDASDSEWQGPAARSYNDRTTEQHNRALKTASLDTQLAELLRTQATQVQILRSAMGAIAASFLWAFPYSVSLWKINVAAYPDPFTGPSAWFQIKFAVAVAAADAGLLTAQGVLSEQTGAAMQTVADGYTQIATEAQAALPVHS